MGDMDNVVKEFLVESYENIDRLDQELLLFERGATTAEILASIFRTIHSLKGTCGFLGFHRLESLTHCGENLLSRLRDGAIQPSPEIATALLSLVVAVRQVLSTIEATGSEGTLEFPDLKARLTALVDGPSQSAPEPTAVPELTEEGLAPATAANAEGKGVANSYVRVYTGVIDRLMDLVGELVLARNQILQFTTRYEDPTFLNTSQRLNLITTELQEGIMKTRMQPIGSIWSKFPRLVRDLATQCGKRVRIEMEGADTELDRTIIEAIKDPLTHVLRNAIDHGIEGPEQRRQNGKPAEGCLVFRAFHEGGQVNIEISDDGAGIDPERVKARAIQRNLITPEQAARMSERELVNLIFLPGFSTAEKVTNVSGRGVGMDVVRTNVERIGGTLDISSRPRKGTLLRIKIPLTLAIIPALLVTSGGERYAIPQVSLLELVRIEAEQTKNALEMVFGSPVYRLRGSLLPVVFLNREIGTSTGVVQETGEAVIHIVVVQADDRQFGLVVDEICDTQEIVVKPLGKQLSGVAMFAGATILGDGKVALILDVLGLAQNAHVIHEVRERSITDAATLAQQANDTRQALLLLGIGADTRLAMPLSLVARLEEFPRDSIEQVGGQEVVQYRGEILPLVRVASVLPDRRMFPRHSPMDDMGDESAALQVVVYSERGRSVGLVVEQIVDIVEEPLTVQRPATRSGVVGSAVIQNRVTEILDVRGIIRSVDPSFDSALD